MDISIIIVNYNTKALLKQCLISVFGKTQDIDFEVIIVDNASHDGSQAMLKNEFPQIKLIESPENLGFGRANNFGAACAKGKYLFLLNSDTILLNNAVKILFDFMENNPKVGICGGNLFDENMKPAHSYKMFLPSIFFEIAVLFSSRIEIWIYGKNRMFNYTNHSKEVGYITGADLMIKTDVFRELNGFDSDFFMYYEETELTYRVKKLGYKIVNVPQSEIIHLAGKSFISNFERLKNIISARNLFYKKTHGRTYHFFANLIFYLTAISRIVIFKLLNNKEKLELWLFVMKNIK